MSSFLESPGFPADDVSEASAKEKQGGGRPPHWDMVFWWTRKPLAGARAVVAGALLPDNTDPSEFKHYLRLNEGVAHRKNPKVPAKWKGALEGARLLDPFAGFGSIPLEAARLGLGEVVAVELLPTAYVFLKAVLEHPKNLGQRLVKDVERWGTWIAERLREDPDMRELYEDDAAVYIGTWEVRCPHCGRWTPLVGNWWLARAPKEAGEGEGGEEGVRSGVFRRLAWMEPVRAGELISIKVVDLNRELGREALKARVRAGQGEVIVDGKTYRVPRSNIDARRETATCLHCNNQIGRGVKEWHVREALRDWNEKLEQYLSGQMDMRSLRETARARPTILVKVKAANGDLEFWPATQEDQEKQWKALEKLRRMWGDPDIPTEPVAPGPGLYDSSFMRTHVWGFDKFYKLFNPRQLLALVKLVKLIREAGKRVEGERLREGRSKGEAFKYAEAVTTYLAMALCKHADYSSLTTSWHPSFLITGHSLATRRISMTWNWDDVVPWTSWTGTYLRNLDTLVDGLSYLVSAVSGSVSDSPSRVRVLLDDATVLGKLGDEKFDAIVTDPPYRDDVAYAELSDFYYVWLKRALSDVADVGGLPVRQPRFVPEAFFSDGVEIETQWMSFADKEVSENKGRSKHFGKGVGSLDHFKELLAMSFEAMADRLADKGVLVTYYAHTSPEAWEALLDAGWGRAGLRITAAHVLVTESGQRLTARGKAGLDVSIVAVWRKGVSGQALAGEAYSEAIGKCEEHVNTLMRQVGKGLGNVNLFVGVLGCVLSVFTGYKKVLGVRNTRELVEEYAYPATAEAIARALGSKELAGRLSSASLFYLLGKVLIARRPRETRRALDRSTLAILAIGTRNEMGRLKDLGLVKRESDKFHLLEPAWGQGDPARAVRSVLEERGIDPRNPVVRTAVDVLHLIEYYASAVPRSEFAEAVEELRARYPAPYEEALGLARVLSKVLPPEDPEKGPVGRALNILTPGRTDLSRWSGGGG